jgi:hypothetical protein
VCSSNEITFFLLLFSFLNNGIKLDTRVFNPFHEMLHSVPFLFYCFLLIILINLLYLFFFLKDTIKHEIYLIIDVQ